MVSGNDRAAVCLARRLRELREHEWADVTLTQADLAKALGAEGKVANATLSSWESSTSPKTPTPARLTTYARFFATRRSMQKPPRLIAADDLTIDEQRRFEQLKEELFSLHAAIEEAPSPHENSRRALLFFDGVGPVVVICTEAPEDERGPLADENNINYARLHKTADSDALLEVFGHIRALNPELYVLFRLPSEVQQSELQNHIVLLGGTGWNRLTGRILSDLREKLPIEQVVDARVPDGEVFRVKKAEDREEHTYLPVTETDEDGKTELLEDVGLIARLPNPFNSNRTVTICNGIHSKGVVGAVLAITDETVRPGNESYLGQTFPVGTDFAMLVRVPVVSGVALAPDMQDSRKRLFEWSPDSTPVGE